MPIRGSPNGARHPRPQAGRDRPEQVVAINRNAWSQSIGTAGRNHPVRARNRRACAKLLRRLQKCHPEHAPRAGGERSRQPLTAVSLPLPPDVGCPGTRWRASEGPC